MKLKNLMLMVVAVLGLGVGVIARAQSVLPPVPIPLDDSLVPCNNDDVAQFAIDSANAIIQDAPTFALYTNQVRYAWALSAVTLTEYAVALRIQKCFGIVSTDPLVSIDQNNKPYEHVLVSVYFGSDVSALTPTFQAERLLAAATTMRSLGPNLNPVVALYVANRAMLAAHISAGYQANLSWIATTLPPPVP